MNGYKESDIMTNHYIRPLINWVDIFNYLGRYFYWFGDFEYGR
jgi:hypothetical protein